jgi:hypothetical protein
VVATPPPAQYFASAADFRRWLETHHDAHRELVVGFHKVGTGEPLACPTCHGAMRIVACITQTAVIDQILTHLRARDSRAAHATHAGARSPPSTRARTSRGASRAPRPSADAPTVP